MTASDPSSDMPATLERPDGHVIAYHRTDGAGPGVVFLGGFMSDMTGSKALHLEANARAAGRGFLRFDYLGHGQSSGAFADGTIGRWTDDALAVLDALTDGPQVLVGSSMGGWIMLRVAVARPERVAGLVGIAVAPDFTEDLMWAQFDEDTRREIEEVGHCALPSTYDDEPYTVTRRLIDDGRNCLVLRAPIHFDGPVRLLHGLEDPDVPWELSVKTARVLTSDDVTVTCVKGGDHRLAEDRDLARLWATVEGVCRQIEAAT